MARQKNKGEFEKWLNNYITTTHTLDEARKKYSYLFNHPNYLSGAYYNKTLGTHMRNKDIDKFNVLYAEHLKMQ